MSNEQYFEANPTSASEPRRHRIALPDGEIDLTTDHGVFSYAGLDLGTRILLLRTPAPPTTGNLLDLGCGAGPIAISLARRSPQATVWAVDVNERALALCRTNAAANNVVVNVEHADSLDAELRFEAIWSNPPIHIGKEAVHELLTRWLDRLTPTGVATMVVQRHLGADSLQRWLSDQGWATERLGSAKGFRLLRSTARAV